eukprot:gb/GECG01010708.1/.p1 GENE.gb/GECG01010708.1/~~gb/GECG01010708.1/.p1  ORF type:complete len:967 (+),score=180.87 gb/GECG01010708.1/:1-2901(+)
MESESQESEPRVHAPDSATLRAAASKYDKENDDGSELEADGDNEEHNTVFVRRLASTVQETELEEMFSEIGPIQRAFIIRDKQTGESKQFGFVQFVLEEDASTALKNLQNKPLKGKHVQLSKARKPGEKPSASEHTSESKTTPKKGKTTEQKADSDENRRSIIVFGLPDGFDGKTLRKRVRKLGNIEHFEWPVTGIGRCPGSTCVARILFQNRQECLEATRKLDKHEIHGYPMRVRHADEVFRETDGRNAARLIIRNMSFQTQESELANMFKEFGPLADVKIAREQTELGTGKAPKARSRGFGFVQFCTKTDAARALQKCNEAQLRKRAIAVDWARSKKHYEVLLKQMAKENKQQSEVKNVIEAEHPENINEETGPSSEDGASEVEAESEDSSVAGKHASVASDLNDASSDQNVAEQRESVMQTTDDVHEGKTLFIRNIPFDATEDEVHRTFRRFGKLRYARLVLDRASGLSRGSGFVQYIQKQDADEALRTANHGQLPPEDGETVYTSPQGSNSGDVVPNAPFSQLREKSAENHHLPASVKAALQSGGIALKDRPLLVTRAIQKEKARQLTQKSEESRKKFDRRHLYLAREGTIAGGTETAKNMPSSDLAKREEASRDKNNKLRNPLFFVSPVRLSVRNLHKGIGDKELKKAILMASEKGLKEGLVSPTEGDPNLWPKAGTKISTMRPKVTQCKVMRDNPRKEGERLRLEADGVTPKSKGFAFVEFAEHFMALAAMRMLNNNPDFSHLSVGGASCMKTPEQSRPRLIVEFTIENAAKLKLQEKRKEAAERKHKVCEEEEPAGSHPVAVSEESESIGTSGVIEESEVQGAASDGDPSDSDNSGEESMDTGDTGSISGIEFDDEGNVSKGNVDDSDIDFDVGEETDTMDESGCVGGFPIPESLKRQPRTAKDTGQPAQRAKDVQSYAAARALASARETKGQRTSAKKQTKRKQKAPKEPMAKKSKRA